MSSLALPGDDDRDIPDAGGSKSRVGGDQWRPQQAGAGQIEPILYAYARTAFPRPFDEPFVPHPVSGESAQCIDGSRRLSGIKLMGSLQPSKGGAHLDVDQGRRCEVLPRKHPRDCRGQLAPDHEVDTCARIKDKHRLLVSVSHAIEKGSDVNVPPGSRQ